MGHGRRATSDLAVRLKLLPLRKDRGAGSDVVGMFIESVPMGFVKSVEVAYKKQIKVVTW